MATLGKTRFQNSFIEKKEEPEKLGERRGYDTIGDADKYLEQNTMREDFKKGNLDKMATMDRDALAKAVDDSVNEGKSVAEGWDMSLNNENDEANIKAVLRSPKQSPRPEQSPMSPAMAAREAVLEVTSSTEPVAPVEAVEPAPAAAAAGESEPVPAVVETAVVQPSVLAEATQGEVPVVAPDAAVAAPSVPPAVAAAPVGEVPVAAAPLGEAPVAAAPAASPAAAPVAATPVGEAPVAAAPAASPAAAPAAVPAAAGSPSPAPSAPVAAATTPVAAAVSAPPAPVASATSVAAPTAAPPASTPAAPKLESPQLAPTGAPTNQPPPSFSVASTPAATPAPSATPTPQAAAAVAASGRPDSTTSATPRSRHGDKTDDWIANSISETLALASSAVGIKHDLAKIKDDDANLDPNLTRRNLQNKKHTVEQELQEVTDHLEEFEIDVILDAIDAATPRHVHGDAAAATEVAEVLQESLNTADLKEVSEKLAVEILDETKIGQDVDRKKSVVALEKALASGGIAELQTMSHEVEVSIGNTHAQISTTHGSVLELEQKEVLLVKQKEVLDAAVKAAGGWRSAVFLQNGEVDVDADISVWPKDEQVQILQLIKDTLQMQVMQERERAQTAQRSARSARSAKVRGGGGGGKRKKRGGGRTRPKKK
jgi:hypothetical protein